MQEEACLFGVPNVTIRDVTERPETIEVGSNLLSGLEPDAIVEAVSVVTLRVRRSWTPPPEYLVDNVAETVRRLLLGFGPPDLAQAGAYVGS